MNAFEQENGDVIDLGAVQDETRGVDLIGAEDVQTGLRFIFGALSPED